MHFQFNLCQMCFMLSRLNLTQREEWQFLIKLSSDINFFILHNPIDIYSLCNFPINASNNAKHRHSWSSGVSNHSSTRSANILALRPDLLVQHIILAPLSYISGARASRHCPRTATTRQIRICNYVAGSITLSNAKWYTHVHKCVHSNKIVMIYR